MGEHWVQACGHFPDLECIGYLETHAAAPKHTSERSKSNDETQWDYADLAAVISTDNRAITALGFRRSF